MNWIDCGIRLCNNCQCHWSQACIDHHLDLLDDLGGRGTQLNAARFHTLPVRTVAATGGCILASSRGGGGHHCLEKWTDEWSSGSHQSPMLTIQRNGNESGFEGKLWGLCHKSGMNAKAVNCAQLQHTQSKVSERIAAPLDKWWILVCHLTPLTEVT